MREVLVPVAVVDRRDVREESVVLALAVGKGSLIVVDEPVGTGVDEMTVSEGEGIVELLEPRQMVLAKEVSIIPKLIQIRKLTDPV